MSDIYYKYMSCADTKHKDYVLDSLKQKYFYFSRSSELRTVNDNSECVENEEHFHVLSLTDDYNNYHMWENFAGKGEKWI